MLIYKHLSLKLKNLYIFCLIILIILKKNGDKNKKKFRDYQRKHSFLQVN